MAECLDITEQIKKPPHRPKDRSLWRPDPLFWPPAGGSCRESHLSKPTGPDRMPGTNE